MIEIVLGRADLARIRFAHSPIWELTASIRTLHDARRQHLCRTWLSDARGRLGGLRLDLLAALAPSGLAPDFMVPPPTGQMGNLDEELELVAATPAATVRAELDQIRHDRPLPTVLRPVYDDPAAHLPTVVAQMRRYWQLAIEPVWPRLRALCAADLSYRMERFAAGGLVGVLEDLHPEIMFRSDRLMVDKPFYCQHRIDLTGSGILLIPCVFSWPTPAVQCCGVEVPALGYPPRGVAELWRQARDDQPDPLCALLGRTRAALLAKLALPSTTTQLACQLDMSPAAVSQQLKILKETALVSSRRRGRLVLYQRTPAAAALLATIQPDGAPPDGAPGTGR
jgi:DNA-binding transcriptional ArsR family regulator